MYSCSLHRAVASNDWDAVEKVLKKEKTYTIDEKDSETGQTPLHVAAYEGHFDMVYNLLSRGANVNARDFQEWTPLHCSTNREHLTISSILITRGADPNALSIDHATPIHYVVRSAYSEELIEVLSLMIEHNAILDMKNKTGESPLMSAVSKGLTESVRFLIDNNANVNEQSSTNRTPLHYAVESNSWDIVLLLLKNGADQNAMINGDPNTLPKAIAGRIGNSEIKSLFLKDNWWQDSTYSAFSEQEPEISDDSSDEEDYTFVTSSVSPGTKEGSFLGSHKFPPSPVSKTESNGSIGRPRRLSIAPFTRSDSNRFLNKMDVGEMAQLSLTENPDMVSPAFGGSPDTPHANGVTENIVGHHTGFYEETGKEVPPNTKPVLLFQPCNYKNWFYHSEHSNFVGKVNRKGSTERFEPLIVSVCHDPINSRYRMILFTRLGDKQVFCESSKSEKEKRYSTMKKGLPKELLAIVKDKIMETRPRDAGNLDLNISLELAGGSNNKANPKDLRDRLLEFETYDPLRAKCFSIGVLYSKEGQTTEDQQFNNENGSPAFEDFLNFLGERIPMKGWLGYRGDLDTKMNATGAISLFRRWKGFEVMFHVSTLLPYTPGVEQQLGRKRRIGNDIVVIVFQEGGVYTPPIRSQFLHTYIVVSPAVAPSGKPGYKIQVASANGVPTFEPFINKSCIYEKTPEFREFLMTKVINSQLSSLLHPQLREKIWCKPKEAYLVRIIKDYARKKEHLALVEPDSFG